MTRALITIYSKADRDRAIRWISKAPTGTRLEFRASKRTLPQNDYMWALLTDIAVQKEHFGRKYDSETWKCIFMNALGKEQHQFVPSLDGATIIPLGFRSSKLSKQDMAELLEYIITWGVQNGVVFHDQEQE